jgi:hypothetical protein
LRPFALRRGPNSCSSPSSGNDFSTPLRHWLKDLQRFAESQEQRIPIYQTEAEIERRKVEEEGEPIRAVNFNGGGNGARVTFDLQCQTGFCRASIDMAPSTCAWLIPAVQLGADLQSLSRRSSSGTKQRQCCRRAYCDRAERRLISALPRYSPRTEKNSRMNVREFTKSQRNANYGAKLENGCSMEADMTCSLDDVIQ